MNEGTLNELKNVIRAILIAGKSKAMPLSILKREYCAIVGKSMPSFGYPDTAALLESKLFSDTVFTELIRSQLYVSPIETEKSKHMSDLVRNTDTKGRSSRGPKKSRVPSSDKTIITKWIGSNGNAARLNRNGPHKTLPNKGNSLLMQNGHSSEILRGYHRQQQQQQQRQQRPQQNGISNTQYPAHTTKTSIQSNQKQSNGLHLYDQKYDGADADANADSDADSDIEKIGLDDYDTDDEEHVYALKNKNNIARYLLTFNEESIHLGELPAVNLDEIIKPGQGFRLLLSQVHSPFKFWFQLKEHADSINSLMDRLNNFYYEDQSMMAQTPIPDEFLEIGWTCAAIFNSEWHRGKIIDILDDTVKVFYVDYGTVSETYKKDVRFLDKQFATQPAYALRGCLDRVRPNDGIWTYEAMLEFLDRLKDFFLVEILGKVTLLNLLERTVYLDLIDTTGQYDVGIGQWLVRSNHAYATNKLLFNYQKRHYNEVYPSFESLENGVYPSIYEIKQMKEHNYDFLAFENTIIIPEMYGYQTVE